MSLSKIPETTLYEADIRLGEHYRDRHTGFTGVATGIAFYQHQSPRVQLSCLMDKKPGDTWLDAPRLELVTANSSNGGGIGFKED